MRYLSTKQPHAHCMGLLLFGIMKRKRVVTMLVSSGLAFVIFVLMVTISAFLYTLIREIDNGTEGQKRIMWAGAWVGWALTVAGVYELKRRGIADLIAIEVVITFVLWHYTKVANTPPTPPNQPPTP